jgi:ADP-ribosylglycohydrolase
MTTLTGSAIGDALGMPFEMFNRFGGALLAWDGTFQSGATNTLCPHLKAGQWTDDTKMARALAECLVANGEYVFGNVAQKYLTWFESGDLRGIGTATHKALQRMARGQPGPWGEIHAEGNGTAMRVAPIGAFYYANPEKAAQIAREDALITHNSIEAQEGSAAVAVAVALLKSGAEKNDKLIFDVLPYLGTSKVKSGLAALTEIDPIENLNDMLDQLVELGTGAHVVKTVPAAFFAFMFTNSFKDAVELAVRAGGDTDTTAAITGALAGTFYGKESIEPYLGQLEDASEILALDEKLHP